MTGKTLYASDPWGDRDLRAIERSRLLTMTSLHEAYKRAVGHGVAGCLLMSWATYGDMLALASLSSASEQPGLLSRERAPSYWYCGRPVVVIEDHPDEVIDFADWNRPEAGVVRLQYGDAQC